MKNEECNNAVLRIVPKINMNKILNIFDELSEKYNDLPVLSNVQKKYYLKSLRYRYDNVLIPVYNKLLEIDNKMNNIG